MSEPESPKPEPQPRPEEHVIDVQSIIKQSSASVPIDVLVKKGKTSVKMVSREKFGELMNQAIKNVLRTHQGKVPIPGEQIEAESKQEFEELLTDYQTAMQAQKLLSTSKDEMTREMQEMKEELSRQKQIADQTIGVEEERRQIIALKEFEYQIEKIIGKVIEKKEQQVVSAGKEVKGWDLEGLEPALRPLIHKLCQEVFATFGPSMLSRDRVVALLEKRLEKMYAHIVTLEDALKALMRSKVYSNAQIAAILRSVGIFPEDVNYEKKVKMLKAILDDNKKLRDDLKKSGKSWATYEDAPGAAGAGQQAPPAAAA